MNPIPIVNTILCTIFCSVYFGVLVISNLVIFKDRFKGTLGVDISVKGGLFGIFMSLPFMPFIYGFSIVNEFSISVITLFFISNVIWQSIFIKYEFKQNLENLFIAISVSNLIAWTFMAISNHLLYLPLGKSIAEFF